MNIKVNISGFDSVGMTNSSCSILLWILCIKNGKVWVEQDSTDLCVVDDLLAAGIPASDIVLGFHHPNKRKLTEFA
ncbi:element excision factor XisI family protein [Zarconia navalis]|uniref:element excision factor XisI family protein n=1 Tax=Zarconia navalis TaxID=2992134 RepID=UPI0029C783A9|nr:element excision factor XisI family protein [Zarconia navalis]